MLKVYIINEKTNTKEGKAHFEIERIILIQWVLSAYCVSFDSYFISFVKFLWIEQLGAPN